MKLESFGRIPPQNIEAEQSVIGSVLLDNNIIPDILSIVKPDDFYRKDHQVLMETIIELFNNNKPIDLVSISSKLSLQGTLDDIGGVEYLATMASFVPSTGNALYYAKIVQEKSVRRQLIKKSNEISNKAYEQDYENAIDIKSDALENLSNIKIDDGKSTKNLPSIAKSLKNEITRKRYQSNNNEEKYYTGIKDYDYWLDGFHEQELTIIGARPAVGKTAFILQIARNLAKKGLNVVFVTLEMSDIQLFSRLVSSESKLNSHKLRKPKLMTEDEYQRYLKDSDIIEQLSIDIEEIKYIQDIRSYCRDKKNKGQLDILFIDYIQLMQTYKKTNTRNEEIGDISRNLKALSKEFNIPVVALAQLNRATTKENREPVLSDLRESGDMEQDADNVILIHKSSDEDDLSEIQERKIIIAKQRNGATGYFPLLFEGKTFSFLSLDKNGNQQSKNIRKEEL